MSGWRGTTRNPFLSTPLQMRSCDSAQAILAAALQCSSMLTTKTLATDQGIIMQAQATGPADK